MTDFLLNGAPATVTGEHPHLLSALRDELGITSPKDGCAPSGQCGCCAVLVDGKATFSCKTSLDRVAGKSVVTLEGLPDDERQRLATAFASTGALQCGFCTPGIVVRTKELLDGANGGGVDRQHAARRLGAHLCRCTGYVKILDAIELLASDDDAHPEPIKGIGSRGVRYEGNRLSLGEHGFIDDLRAPGMLHGFVRLADHARADVVGIDSLRAASMPGVVRVLTAADVPGQLEVGLIHKDWPVFIPDGGRTSYLGDVMALVVADTREHARAAADAVDVEYEVLRPITDPVAAVDDPEDAVWQLDGNVLSRSAYQRGDVDAALATAAHTVHEVFETQRVEQAFLEPESTLAVPTATGVQGVETLHIYSGGQGVWDDRDQIASVLGIDAQRVTVELVSNGGAFGGKEDLSNQAQTALAAFLLGVPVKCTLTREQSLRLHAKRHPIRMEYWAGCDADGTITAVRARMIGDSGPYASVGMKVLERAAGHATGPYTIVNVDIESVAARTNNPVGGAFRGFGANQAQFAMEGVVDRLAELAGVDPWAMRWRNAVEPGAVWGPGQVMDDGSLGAKACLDAVKPHWVAARAAGKAVGVGLGLKNSGLGNGFLEIARATVRLDPDGSVEVRHCWTEMGQGVHSVAVAVVTEELGVEADAVRVVVDTSRELGAGQTTGSRGTLMGAGAIKDACERLTEAGSPVGVELEGEYRVDWTNALGDGVAHPVIHSTFGYACQMVVVGDDGEVEQVVAAHDVGRAVNPVLCEGQVEGAVHMGLGYALTEDFPADDQGRPLNLTLSSLGILRPKDVPDIVTILVECPQPDAPYGVKGVGEIGLVPTAPAVAAALHAHDGQWRAKLPMRPRKGLQRKLEGTPA